MRYMTLTMKSGSKRLFVSKAFASNAANASIRAVTTAGAEDVISELQRIYETMAPARPSLRLAV